MEELLKKLSEGGVEIRDLMKTIEKVNVRSKEAALEFSKPTSCFNEIDGLVNDITDISEEEMQYLQVLFGDGLEDKLKYAKKCDKFFIRKIAKINNLI